MIKTKVTIVNYKKKNQKYYRKGVEIYNRNTNTFTLIDCKTLEKVTGPFAWYESLESSAGNIYFNMK